MLTTTTRLARRPAQRRVAAAAASRARALSSLEATKKAIALREGTEEEKPSQTLQKIREIRKEFRQGRGDLVFGVNEDSLTEASPLPKDVSELAFLDQAELANPAARYNQDGTLRRVVIRQEGSKARQAPIRRESIWHIKWNEDEADDERWNNTLMDWRSSADPYQSIETMEFQNAAQAVIFAKKQGWLYEVEEPIQRKLRSDDCQYQDNFLPQWLAGQVAAEGTRCKHWERDQAGKSHYFRPLTYHGTGTVRQHGPNRDAKTVPSTEGYYKTR